MHIAICDDNIADRKQLERLLGRESDKHKASSGVFFCDSFGNTEQLRHNPMPYELFFLDLVFQSPNAFEFALELQELGVTAPMVLCCSKIPYREIASQHCALPSNLLFLDKPVKTNELSNLLDHAILLNSRRVSTIELRNDKGTRYVYEDDILYVTGSSTSIQVHLADRTDFPVKTSLENFYSSVAMYPHLKMVTEHMILNLSHITGQNPFRISFSDGSMLPSSPLLYTRLKKDW